MKTIALHFCSVMLLFLGGYIHLHGQTHEGSDRQEFDSLAAFVPQVNNFRIENGVIDFSVLSPKSIRPGEDSAAWRKKNYSISFGILEAPSNHEFELYGKLAPSKDSLNFQLPLPYGVFPGEHLFSISCEEKSIWMMNFKVESPNSKAGQQPVIEEISPRGTRPGRAVSVKGRNLGNDLNDIYIWFTGENGQDLPEGLSSVINPAHPSYITSPDADGFQTLKFSVPGENSWGETIQDYQDADIFEHELRMKVVVKGQPSANSPVISVIKENTGFIILVILAAIIALIVLVVWFIAFRMRKRGVEANVTWKSLIVDPASNRYSIARVQALAWTILLVVSYSYYVIMTFLILDKSVIPSFDPSLLILMGISTGGLLIAGTQDRAKPQTSVVRAAAPNLSDLIMENGRVSMASLQLLLFTVVGLGIYMVYMTSPDLVETGLPTMPDTLLALMGISQGGFLTGKAVENTNQGGATQVQQAYPAANTTVPPQTPVQPVAPPATTIATPVVATPVAQVIPPVTAPPATAETSPPAAEMNVPPTAEQPPATPKTPPAEDPQKPVG